MENSQLKEKYVCGFIFTNDAKKIVLINKNRPYWQKGLLNGVGGKVQFNESTVTAMTRECLEETGVNIPESNWEFFAKLEINGVIVLFYKTFLHQKAPLKNFVSMTDEIVEVFDIDTLSFSSVNSTVSERLIPNLKWLIPLALTEIENGIFVEISKRNV